MDVFLIFRKEYRDYMMDDNQMWKDKLEKVKEFIDTYKRKPKRTKKNIEEKRLGEWIGTNKAYTKNGIRKKCMKNDDLYNLWCEFFKKYNI